MSLHAAHPIPHTDPSQCCAPSSHGVGASVMKNWLPFVFGPALAIERIPAPVCLSIGVISSSNFSLSAACQIVAASAAPSPFHPRAMNSRCVPVDGGAATASARGITRLNHKVGDDAVHRAVIVVAATRLYIRSRQHCISKSKVEKEGQISVQAHKSSCMSAASRSSTARR